MDRLVAHPPLYLAESQEECWKCHLRNSVYALIASDITDDDGAAPFEGPFFLRNIKSLSEDIVQLVQSKCPRFQKVHSKTAGTAYYANTCTCGVNFGDHYLFSEPDGAFFPTSIDKASQVRVTALPINDIVDVVATYGSVPHGIAV